MDDTTFFSSADDYALYDLGVLKKGTWAVDGSAQDWELDSTVLDERLPRWLLREPVLTSDTDFTHEVYIRGLHSKQLSRERRASMVRQGYLFRPGSQLLA